MNQSPGGTGLGTSDMQDNAEIEMTGLDFNNIWAVADSNRYPGLKNLKSDFRGPYNIEKGKWSNVLAWEQSFTGSDWMPATTYPSKALSVKVEGEDTIVVDNALNNQLLEVKATQINGTLEIDIGDAVTFAFDTFEVDGGLSFQKGNLHTGAALEDTVKLGQNGTIQDEAPGQYVQGYISSQAIVQSGVEEDFGGVGVILDEDLSSAGKV